MCGILGRISIKNKSYKKNDFNIFHQALDLQHHRGPDGRGVKENNITLTPNGDSENDTWFIKNIDSVNNTVKVFNRWGVKVFDASNYNNATNNWGGESTEGGSGLLPAGSYYYVIEYTSTEGLAKTAKGWMYINY